MDDTNPSKEDNEYVENIKTDVRWLGFDWGEHFYYSADYFERMYQVACDLIRRGRAYVCELSQEQWKEYRGVPTRPGQESPFRHRPPEESLALFGRMRAGEFPDGSLCLRAKIDMASPNMHLRDPVLYRIMREHHYRTGDAWCLYPMYDFAHPLEDAFEGVTHSLCSLEFVVHRPLYDWVVAQLEGMPYRPHQYEFARLNLTYTVMSKRKLLQLVEEKAVTGWDDPRMPTISGMRRRGVTPQSLRNFAYHIGVTKYMSLTDVAVLEHAIREDLNKNALRRLGVLRPLKVIISNFPEGQSENCAAVNNPDDAAAGTRDVPFSREVWIEQDDFMEVPSPKYFRLKPGGEVRLKYAYIIKCDEVVKDVAGCVVELRCTADLGSKSGGPTAGRKVKGTIHWVSAAHAIEAEVRLYDRLFTVPEPDSDGDFQQHINPHSLEVVTALVEPSLRDATPDARYQFERLAYFALDPDSSPAKPVFNRTITLKDTWAKTAQR
jgi:glutaminyl-tRNA synthetase